MDELHHVIERRECAKLQVVVPRDVVRLAHRREGLRLLHRVDPEVRLEVELHVQHVRRIPGLLGDDLQDLRNDRV